MIEPARSYRPRASWAALMMLLFVPVQAFGAATTGPIPPLLKKAEGAHTAMHKKLAQAVVGIVCKGRMPNGMPSDFYGTGAVISPDGLILTDLTVIPEGATDVKIYFTNGKVLPATIRKTDVKCEGVLLKVEGKDFPHMKLADSAQYKVGDPTYSWGNPYFTIQRDGQVSLSTGTISGVYQTTSADDQSRYSGWVIETDAAVNPGSDGGPLTDCEGNLLGIMSLAFSRSRWLGLAIPSHVLSEGLPELKTLKPAVRPKVTPEIVSVWGPSVAFGDASAAAAPGVVGLWIEREGDTVAPPALRTSETLPGYSPIPPGQARGPFEAKRPTPSVTTGFLIDAEGFLLTAAYSLEDPAKIKHIYVYLADGARLEAKFVNKHDYFDLALLKIESAAGKALKPVELAKGDPLAQGRAVAVLGRSEAPGGLTVNAGSVSGMGRRENICAQISALINYGNLGGPIIDLDGRVIGMATALNEKTPWRQNCGVGFLLPADKILEVLPDLKAGKKFEKPKHPFLGVQAAQGAMDVKGAKVASVVPTGPAAAAGIQANDLIVELNGKAVEDWPTLVKTIRDCQIDQVVKVKLKRGAEEKVVDVKLGSQ
ncbi:MAG: trypsin-like peptidase domain-containing protein [Planctomycetota bacterium]|nr:trypsin-like peptidase domain-containing protein [Planctomycetota bacterium]